MPVDALDALLRLWTLPPVAHLPNEGSDTHHEQSAQ